VSLRELRDGEYRTRNGAWREHRRNARAIFEPGVEERLHLRDLVAARARDVLDGYRKIPPLEGSAQHRLESSRTLHEHVVPAVVHHHLRDVVIAQQILDRLEERHDSVEAAHSAPRST